MSTYYPDESKTKDYIYNQELYTRVANILSKEEYFNQLEVKVPEDIYQKSLELIEDNSLEYQHDVLHELVQFTTDYYFIEYPETQVGYVIEYYENLIDEALIFINNKTRDSIDTLDIRFEGEELILESHRYDMSMKLN